MKRRTVLGSALAAGFQRSGFGAQADQKTLHIGWVTAQSSASLVPYIAALRDALASLGYVEGRNLVIEFRYGDDRIERVPELVAELEHAQVDIILAQGTAVSVISELPTKVPIAYVFSGDPVSAGFADSLSHPRANMTGLTLMAAELNSKRLEILRQIVPALKHVAIVANPEHPGSEIERNYSDNAAQQFGLKIQFFPTRTPPELSAALDAIAASRAQALSVFSDGFAVAHRQQIIDFATARRLPVVAAWPVFADSGAVCTYGPRLADSYRRLASYVDRMAQGAKPADLPIERPSTFELVLNLKTAEALGLTVPQALLLRADRLIE